jgi:2-hydroxychromene-2-carboxylate isomerase
MSTTVDYYFTPQSPWTYLGHERFAQIARAAGATVRVLPIDLGGKVFPDLGRPAAGPAGAAAPGLPLLELQRFSDFLHAPLNLKPKYFPGVGR